MKISSARLMSAAALAVLAACAATPARAGVGNFCPSGTCDIAHPVYVNVYWDSSVAQWNADAAASSLDFTEAKLDDFLLTMVHSSYFSALSQYSVTSVASAPSFTAAGCLPPRGNIGDAINRVKDLATCVLAARPELNNGNTILNVFMPPSTKVDLDGWCTGQGTYTVASHDKFGSPVEIALLPTNSACAGSFPSLTSNMSHEMVEAATDPIPASPTGWKQTFGNEIGDFCENLNSNFMNGNVQFYWSNSANACVPGVDTATPVFDFHTNVCGTGRNMRITLSGTLGPAPWDLASGVFGGQTLYLQAAVAHSTPWDAGSVMGSIGQAPDSVGLGSLAWTQSARPNSDTIQINGFTGAYGGAQVVSPGDSINFTAWSVANGTFSLSSQVSLTAPFPNSIGPLALAPGPNPWLATPLYPDQTKSIAGRVLDAGGCGVEGAQVALSATAGNIQSPVATASDGTFTAAYTAPDASGPQTVTAQVSGDPGIHNTPPTLSASLVVTTRPQIASVTPGAGAAAGGRSAVAQGAGFIPGATSVTFGTATAAPRAGLTSTSAPVTTPRSPLSGSGTGYVTIGAVVDGLTADPVRSYAPPQYLYEIPGQPVLTYVNTGCLTGTLTATIYDADGNVQPTGIVLSAPSGTHFNSGGSKVQNMTVTSGQSVTVGGGGPVTAANAANASLTNSLTLPDAGTMTCGLGFTIGGLNTYNPSMGQCLACGGDVVIFSEGALVTDGGWVELSGPDVQNVASQYSVGSVSLSTKISAVPAVLAADRPAAAFALASRIVSVAARGRAPGETLPLQAKALIGFPIPTASAPASYRLLHFTPSGRGGVWRPVAEAQIARHGQTARAPIQETGLYVLARPEANGK